MKLKTSMKGHNLDFETCRTSKNPYLYAKSINISFGKGGIHSFTPRNKVVFHTIYCSSKIICVTKKSCFAPFNQVIH